MVRLEIKIISSLVVIAYAIIVNDSTIINTVLDMHLKICVDSRLKAGRRWRKTVLDGGALRDRWVAAPA